MIVSGKEGIDLQGLYHLQHNYIWLIQISSAGVTSSLGSRQEIMITVFA